MEARLYAEEPASGFLPVSGKLRKLSFAGNCRVDTGVEQGDSITPFYDPMIAKIIVHGANRADAIKALSRALENTHVAGTQTNASFLAALNQHETFVDAQMTTGLIDEHLDALLPSNELSSIERMLGCLALLQWPENQSQRGFRLFGAASKRVILKSNDSLTTHSLVFLANSQVDFYINEHTDEPDVSIVLDDITPNTIRYRQNGQSFTATIFTWNAELTGDAHAWVKQGQLTRSFESPNPLSSATQSAGDANRILAPMTGVIRVVHAQIGASVSEGDPLVCT